MPIAFGGPASASPSWCAPDEKGEYRAERMPSRFDRSECNLDGARVRLGSVTVPAPSFGTGNYAEISGPRGEELAVSLDLNGVYAIGEQGSTGTSANTSPTDCNDATKGAGTAFRVKTTLNYGIRTGTIPANVGTTNGVTALRNGLNSILTLPNDCGEGRDPNALTHNYTGATTTAGNFTSTGECASLDGSHVIEFGALPGSAIGMVCLQWDTGTGSLTRWDMRFRGSEKWDHTLTDGCYENNAWDILSVAVHEWGHIYGLSHVSEDTSANLTMSTAINGKCQVSERTLGRGDMDHMFAKYGIK